VEGRRKKIKNKKRQYNRPTKPRPLVAGSPATSGHPSAAGQQLDSVILLKFFNFFKHFSTLGSVNLAFSMETGDFTFFEKFFPKFRVHLDLHIYCWDFWFMKN
jgi:hypothetical protein